MKKEKFSESLNNIDDKYIEEAVNYSVAENSDILEANISDDTKYSSADASNGAPSLKADISDDAKSSSAGTAQKSTSKDNSTIKYAKSMKVWRIIAIAACAVIACGLGITLIASGIATGASKAMSESAYEYALDGDYYEADKAADDYDYYDQEELSLNDTGSYDYIPAPQETAATTSMDEEAALGASGATTGTGQASTDAGTTPEKIIYTVYISMESTDFDSTVSDIDRCVQAAGGYYENSESYNNGSSYRSAYYTIRVPAENLDSFLIGVNTVGKITSINKNASDVSDYYYDTESRLETAKTKLKRLQELLAQAEDMSDIITIENEISDTEYEIDSLSGTLKNYDSRISYSTVTIDLREVYKVSIDEPAPLTFGQRISNAFTNGVSGFGEFLEDLVVWLACSWIWLVIIAAVVVAVVLIIKKASRKKKEK